MNLPVPTRPDPSERARSTMRAASFLEIATRGATDLISLHGTDQRGRPLLVVADSCAIASTVAASPGPVPVQLSAARVGAVPVADRARDHVSMRGRIDVVPPHERAAATAHLVGTGRLAAIGLLPVGCSLLRVEPVVVRLDGTVVEAEAYRRAEPDPLAAQEDRLIRDLVLLRPRELAVICTLLDPAVTADAVLIVPSGVDRYGVTLRIATPDRIRWARIPFPERSDTCCAVTRAWEHLIDLATAHFPR